jgi:hypothetical protein
MLLIGILVVNRLLRRKGCSGAIDCSDLGLGGAEDASRGSVVFECSISASCCNRCDEVQFLMSVDQ